MFVDIHIHMDKVHIRIQHLKLNIDVDISIIDNYGLTLGWIISIHIAIPSKFRLLKHSYCERESLSKCTGV